MRGARALPLRRVLVAGIVLSAIGVMSTEVACVIAQPTDNVPSLPASRPVITSAVPSTTMTLTSWPSSFTLSVELVDPTVEVKYSTFIDYNPITGDGYKGSYTSQLQSGTIPSDRIRTYSLTIPPPLDIERCHVIEIVVSLTYNFTDPRQAHSPPDPPGGDNVAWFYAPGGDLTGCPALDAGIDATVIVDADAESGAQ